jgi:hypothetical protein
MIDDELVLRVERLRDSLEELRSDLRKRYKTKAGLVSAAPIRTQAAQLAERWLVEVAAREDVKAAITGECLADLNVEFQRLLTYSERPHPRKKYDASLLTILRDFRASVVVVLKRNRGLVAARKHDSPAPRTIARSSFVGQSFAEADAHVNDTVHKFLTVFGLLVSTGEKPSAGAVSAKVKARIDEADLFVGIFTRRDKLAGRDEWAASAWVMDEKAYALAKGKSLILLKEQGVRSVGGLQGDYEYIEFRRDRLEMLLIRLLETLRGVYGG